MRGALAALALCSSGCFSPDNGTDPPLESFYFPVAIQVSPAATRMYVVNSNFDLQFNGGTLQVFDLDRLRAVAPRSCQSDSDCEAERFCDLTPSQENSGVPSAWCVDRDGPYRGLPCGAQGEKHPTARLTQPGRCGPIDPQGSGVLVTAVGIGAFATDALFRSRPPLLDGVGQAVERAGGRLFVPVRGDSTLHFLEVDDDSKAQRLGFEIDCGQSGNDGECDDDHRRGDDPDAENTRGLRLPTEPFGLDATADGEAVLVTHQTEGKVSLFVNDWGSSAASLGSGPKLEFVVGDLPSRPIGIAAIPEPAIVAAKDIDYQPGFLVTFRNAAEIRQIRYFDDKAASPARPFIQQTAISSISANSVGFDSRGLAVDAQARQQCEAGCGLDTACLQLCAGVPLGIYISNRTPSSLLVGETVPNSSATSSDDLPYIYESNPVSFGPSRVLVGEIINRHGQPERRIFIVSFDAGQIGVFDPELGGFESFKTGRGPQALALDSQHGLAYVGHFLDSYVGVIDLDQRHQSYGTMILTLGVPSPPRASK